MPRPSTAYAGAALMLGATLFLACRRTPERAPDPTTSTAAAIEIRPALAAAGESSPPRPGMEWIAAGTLRAGTPPDVAPRVAEEEAPGTPTELGGFYIDKLPYPNEPGAIPTSNVTRDEAAQLCASGGKRLCTELEWERACKGPNNQAYEYGNAYRASVCGTGASADDAARRPVGEHAACKSGFGVADMHGGVWEWTDSPWARGSATPLLGVLRGGNAVAGELVGRCANAIGRPTNKRTPTMGFRCCAGKRNDVVVPFTPSGTPSLRALNAAEELHATWEPLLRPAMGTLANHFTRAWRWLPVANEDLVLILGCDTAPLPTCVLAVGRSIENAVGVIRSIELGRATATPDVTRLGDNRHLRVRGLDPSGTFGVDITYAYGRVEFGEMRRP